MQNNQQQIPEKEKDQYKIPSNFPRFSVLGPSPVKPPTPPNQRPSQKKSDGFQGFAKKMESTTRQDDDSISLISAIPNSMEESFLNETINKELHKERKLILQYVNSSLNDHTVYIKDLGKDMKDQHIKHKDLQDKQQLMMRTQIATIEQNYKIELDQMNQKFSKMIIDQKQVLEQQISEKENRLYSYCNDIEKNLDSKIVNLSQRLQLQLELKDNKLNDGSALKKLDTDIQNINNKIHQIQQLSNLDDLSAFNSQMATFSQELQSVKQQLQRYKEDLDNKMFEINENTKQFLKNIMNENSNNLISSQNYKDKIFEGQIEEIQKYITGFSKVVQNKLNITNDDLNLFIENDKSKPQKNPFSFGGGYNMQNDVKISTMGTMQSAEFEVKDNNQIIIKKENGNQQNQYQNKQQPSTSYKQYQTINTSNRISHAIGSNNDYYNIYQDMPNQGMSGQSSVSDINTQQQKKKKRIFGEENTNLPPILNNNFVSQPSKQNRSINTSPSKQHPFKPEQKTTYDSFIPQTLETETQRTESDYVQFETMPNKESFQNQHTYQYPNPVLESKLSVKVNEHVEVYEQNDGLSDSDSDEQQSTYSNFRLKDTMDFIQREVIQNNVSNQTAGISQYQQPVNIQYGQHQSDQMLSYNQQSQQSQQIKTSNTDNQIKYNQLNLSPQGSQNKRLNTILESEQEYSGKKDDPQLKSRDNLTSFMNNKMEITNPSSHMQNIHNNYGFSNDYKITIPNGEAQQYGGAGQQNRHTPKRKLTSDGINYMISSKGKSNFSQAYQAQSSLGGYQNDYAEEFKPKWGYDSVASKSEQGEEIEYQLDDDGYLLDQNGQYLLDDAGQKVQLTQDNINYLQQNQMISDI